MGIQKMFRIVSYLSPSSTFLQYYMHTYVGTSVGKFPQSFPLLSPPSSSSKLSTLNVSP